MKKKKCKKRTKKKREEKEYTALHVKQTEQYATHKLDVRPVRPTVLTPLPNLLFLSSSGTTRVAYHQAHTLRSPSSFVFHAGVGGQGSFWQMLYNMETVEHPIEAKLCWPPRQFQKPSLNLCRGAERLSSFVPHVEKEKEKKRVTQPPVPQHNTQNTHVHTLYRKITDI